MATNQTTLDEQTIEKYRCSFKHFLPMAFSIVNPGKEFLPNWHLDAICHHLDEVHKGNIKRLIINMPPRALKSVAVNVAWPAWLMGCNPATRILSASYSNVLSLKHALDSKVLICSPQFKQIFPELKLNRLQNSKGKFLTTKQGFRFSTSIGGSVTGEGGDLLILDDPHNALQVSSPKRRRYVINWFKQSFASRLDNKKTGKIVIVMQRLHQGDLSGFLLGKQSQDWTHLNIPAIANKTMIFDLGGGAKFEFNKGDYLHPSREGEAELKRARRELGDTAFSAQYLQTPLQVDTGMINKSWFRYYEGEIERKYFTAIVVSWDTAIKICEHNSYTVGTCWGLSKDKKHYLLDMVRGKFEYPDLKREIEAFAEKWNPQLILIEDRASGQSLIQDFELEGRWSVFGIQPTQEKIVRFARVSRLFEANLIYLPTNAVWRPDYEEELLLFPHSRASDQVDSTSQYLNYMLDNVLLWREPRIYRL